MRKPIENPTPEQQASADVVTEFMGGGTSVPLEGGGALWTPGPTTAEELADAEEAAHKENALREAADLQPNTALTESVARKEFARWCAQNGRTLVSARAAKTTTYSTDLYPGQPVLYDDSTLAYATGYESGEGYELRLGDLFGPLFTAKKVRPLLVGNYRQLRAKFLADALADQLMDLSYAYDTSEERTKMRRLGREADSIMGELLWL